MTHIFIWKHNVYKEMRSSIILGKGKSMSSWERVVLIKSLICARIEKTRLGRAMKEQSKQIKFVSWYGLADTKLILEWFKFKYSDDAYLYQLWLFAIKKITQKTIGASLMSMVILTWKYRILLSYFYHVILMITGYSIFLIIFLNTQVCSK